MLASIERFQSLSGFIFDGWLSTAGFDLLDCALGKLSNVRRPL